MMKSSSTSPVILLSLLCGAALISPANGAAVMNQIGDTASYDFSSGSAASPSQIFIDFPTFDSAVLDDFSVTSEELIITRVSALFQAEGGFVSFLAVDGYSLSIYSDVNAASSTLVGDIAHLLIVSGAGASVTQVIDGGDGSEYGLVSLDAQIVLPSAGTYWVGVSPKSALSTTGQFRIPNGGATGPVTPGNTNARLANPGNGFGNGTLSSLNQDYAYSVTAVPEPAAMALWMISATAFCLKRRRIRHA